MADRAKQVTPAGILGGGAAALLLLLTVGTLVTVALRAESTSSLNVSDWAAIRFTVKQALVSAAASVLLAIPVARALARRQFRGRSAMIALLGAPFILPVIVAVLGLLAVFGRAGLISEMIAPLGLGPLNIYGFYGVVLAHVFFNLPLVTRLILQGWLAIPGEHFRLAAQLGMGPREVAQHLERPMLRAVLPGAFVTVFLLCTTSFAVALALGGGPKATTVELAIYQAFRFDFDLSKAALLALVQFGLCAVGAGVALWVAIPAGFGAGLDRPHKRWDGAGIATRIVDGSALVFVAAFLFLPLGMVVLKGLMSLLDLPSEVFPAALASLGVAIASALLVLLMALPLAVLVVRLRARKSALGGVLEGTGYLSIAVSPMVVGTGLFILLFPFVDPFAIALPVTALVNASMSLPFAMRALVPAVRDAEAGFGRLADSLGMTGWARFKLAIWPRLRRPTGFAAGLAAALSMGDLGVIALFADPDQATLPLLLYRLMAAYRMDDAGGVALLLLVLSLTLFWIFDRGGRANAAA